MTPEYPKKTKIAISVGTQNVRFATCWISINGCFCLFSTTAKRIKAIKNTPNDGSHIPDENPKLLINVGTVNKPSNKIITKATPAMSNFDLCSTFTEGTPKNNINATAPNRDVNIKLICQLNPSTIPPLITGPYKAPIVINAEHVPIALPR